MLLDGLRPSTLGEEEVSATGVGAARRQAWFQLAAPPCVGDVRAMSGRFQGDGGRTESTSCATCS